MDSTNTSKPISAAEDTNSSEAALACVHRASISTSSTGPSPAFSLATNVYSPLGMTVRRLGRLADETSGGRQALAGLTTSAWLKLVLKHYDLTKGSLCQQLQAQGDAGIGIATWFVSFYARDTVLEFLDTLEHFFAMEPQGLDTVIWFFRFSVVNPNADLDDAAGESRLFAQAIQSVGNFVMMLASLHNPTTVLTRAWCMYEFYTAWNSGLRIEFALPRAQRAQLIEDARSERTRFSEFLQRLANVRSESSTCYSAKVTDFIHAKLESSVGFAGLDILLHSALQSWMVQLLQCKIDEASADRKYDETAQFLNADDMLHGRLRMNEGGVRLIEDAKQVRKRQLATIEL
jgi:hypothetical protein